MNGERALAKAVEIGDELLQLERRRARLVPRLRYWWLIANRGGVTYSRIRQACKVPNSTLAQAIATASEEHPDATTRCECVLCGHSWTPRKQQSRPSICPSCHSAHWEQG